MTSHVVSVSYTATIKSRQKQQMAARSPYHIVGSLLEAYLNEKAHSGCAAILRRTAGIYYHYHAVAEI